MICEWKLKFLDSIQFLPSSLATLVENLKTKGVDQFETMMKYMGDNADLFLRKGCYPYEYFDSFSKFDEAAVTTEAMFLQFIDR